MRRTFADELYVHMDKNKKIVVIVGDLGYKMFDQIKESFSGRFLNVGASEQAMVDLAIGLALRGKIPVVYSITTFLLYRPFESLRNYINHEKIPVKLIGSGRDKDYLHDGISHWALEDRQIMELFPNIHSEWPDEKIEIPSLVNRMIRSPLPWYVNLKR